MPLVKLQTSVKVEESKKAQLLSDISKVLAEVTGKPESYIMVSLEQADMCFAGSDEPAAFADVRGIGGLSGDVNAKLSERMCALLGGSLGLDASRVYLTFTDVPASNWGHNGSTFG